MVLFCSAYLDGCYCSFVVGFFWQVRLRLDLKNNFILTGIFNIKPLGANLYSSVDSKESKKLYNIKHLVKENQKINWLVKDI